MTRDEVIALVRAIGGSDRADPVCQQGDMITLDVDEVVRLVNIAAAQQFDASLTNPTKCREDQTQTSEPVAMFHAHPADWQYTITLLPGVPMLPDGAPLYTHPARPVALSWDVQMPDDVAKWITAHPPKLHPARPVVRLTDDDYLEIRAVTYDVVGMGDPWWFLHYGHAVESAVLKKNGLEVE